MFKISSLFLPPCSSCCLLRRFLPIALDHDHTQKATDNGRSQQDQNDRNANSPDPRREEIVEGVPKVNEWLEKEKRGLVSFSSRKELLIRGAAKASKLPKSQ